jgi:eukaryotic translation initiation factor 2C
VAKVARKDATEDFGTFQCGDNRYYLKAGADDLERRLVANRGYFSTIKPAVGSAVINVNTTTSTFFKSMLLGNFMEPFGAENRTKLECILKGLKVRIEYTRGKDSEVDIDNEERRIKTIWDINGSASSTTSFKKEENGGMKDISVKSYLEKSN